MYSPSEASLRADSYGDDLPDHEAIADYAKLPAQGPFRVVEGTVIAGGEDDGCDDRGDRPECRDWVGEFYGKNPEATAAFACRALNAHRSLVAVLRELAEERVPSNVNVRQAQFEAESGLREPAPLASTEERLAYARAQGDWLVKRWRALNERVQAALLLAGVP